MSLTRILLADDHPEFLNLMKSILGGRYDIVGTVPDGAALVVAAQQMMPDLIISDINMPGMSGFQAAETLFNAGESPNFIFLTIESSPEHVAKALSIGARGYILKQYAFQQVGVAIDKVLTGGTYVSPQIDFTA